MKLFTKLLAVFLIFSAFSNFSFASNTHSNESQKFYVQSSDVKVANNGIFVNYEGIMLNVSAIFVDEMGSYISGLGVCSYCHRPNDDLGRCQNARCPNYGR